MIQENDKKGFTLIELLAVVILLGILMTLAYPNVISVYNDIKRNGMILQENTIRQRAQMYVADCYDVESKWGLTGCGNANVTADQGYIYIDNLVTDQYLEPVEYNGKSCTGYVDYKTNDYTVCLKCGEEGNITYQTNNAQCTFDHSDTSYVTFDYTGSGYYTFTANGEPGGNGVSLTTTTGPVGYYKIELWGASGSTEPGTTSGGAYTSGVVYLKANKSLYFYIGGAGSEDANSTSYNGGRSSLDQYPGGGATDVRLIAGDWSSGFSLASRIMVAAGGGGGKNGRAGGGLIGWPNEDVEISGGKQVGGGTGDPDSLNGAFGVGGTGCGGGSGYWGGAGHSSCEIGGAGGSSYISGHLGCISIAADSLQTVRVGCINTITGTPIQTMTCATHYSGTKFEKTVMIDGNGYGWGTTKNANRTQMPDTKYGKFKKEGVGHIGNGFARLTYLGA